MLSKESMQEIQDLKLRGYSQSEIVDYYIQRGKKPPSRPTIRKYYEMNAVPQEPGFKLAKDKAFDQEPFRSMVIEILRNNAANSHMCISSVYDVLEEKFIENGHYESLPGNEQTLRNYVRYLKKHDIITAIPKNTRIYDHVFDTAPGEQMLVDFGQQSISKGCTIHFLCLLLRYSRFLLVFAQDHKFNAEEACRSMYRAFCKLGGRPGVLVIDQDAVFVASETYGEVIQTRTFEDFCSEQELKLWVCHKADPESKGPIENSVGFVKKNFFSARTIESIDDVWRSLPGWLERKNNRIHQSTFCVPSDIFSKVEKNSLRPLFPSLYENSPSSFVAYDITNYPFVPYKTCKYSVPRDQCFKTVYYKVIGNFLHIYNDERQFLCKHPISECKGRTFQLEEHKKPEPTEWMAVAERLRRSWNCIDFQHFINGFKKENPRYLTQQLTAVEEYLSKRQPERAFVAGVMKVCCEQYRYKFSQFITVYEQMEKGLISEAAISCSSVQTQDLSVYQQAFSDRCNTQEGMS